VCRSMHGMCGIRREEVSQAETRDTPDPFRNGRTGPHHPLPFLGSHRVRRIQTRVVALEDEMCGGIQQKGA
jgi:hypothetical protein